MDLTHCLLGNFSCVLPSADFFQNHQSIKHFVGPDLGPNCLQRLSADDTIRQRVQIGVDFGKENCILITTFIFAGHLVSEDATESDVKSLGKVQRLGPARITPQTFTGAVCLDVRSEDARS